MWAIGSQATGMNHLNSIPIGFAMKLIPTRVKEKKKKEIHVGLGKMEIKLKSLFITSKTQMGLSNVAALQEISMETNV